MTGSGDQVRLGARHLPVAGDRRLCVVDLILRAEDDQERDMQRLEALVERAVIDVVLLSVDGVLSAV